MKALAILTAATSLAALSAPAAAAPVPSVPAPYTTTAINIADTVTGTSDYRDPPPYARAYGRRYKDRDWDRDRYDDRWDDDDDYRERRLTRRDRIWRGRDGRYYCKRGDGTTGLVIGAGLGALAGRAIDTRGDRTLGTVLGAVAGGLIGREIDRGELRCR